MFIKTYMFRLSGIICVLSNRTPAVLRLAAEHLLKYNRNCRKRLISRIFEHHSMYKLNNAVMRDRLIYWLANIGKRDIYRFYSSSYTACRWHTIGFLIKICSLEYMLEL